MKKIIRLFVLLVLLILTGCNKEESYKLTFMVDDEVYEVQTITAENSPVEPEIPFKEGYDFIRWDADYRNIKDDTVVRAIFEHREHTIWFYNGDAVERIENLKYGEILPIPADLVRESHDFKGWYLGDTKLGNDYIVKSDLIVKAKWDLKQYTIKFVIDDEVVLEQIVNHGDMPEEPNTDKENYDFSGWNVPIEPATKDMTYTGQYLQIKMREIYKDCDGTILGEYEYYLGSPKGYEPPIPPEKEGCVFSHYQAFESTPFLTVYTAVYDCEENTINFTTLSSKGVLKWEPILGASSYDIEVGLYKTYSLEAEVDLNILRNHISVHTKVKVTCGEYSGYLYMTKTSDDKIIQSQGPKEKVSQPTNFRIESGSYLVCDRAENDAPSWSSASYILYYENGYSYYAVSVARASTIGSFSLSHIEAWLTGDSVVKVVVQGHGDYATSDPVAITIRRIGEAWEILNIG